MNIVHPLTARNQFERQVYDELYKGTIKELAGGYIFQGDPPQQWPNLRSGIKTPDIIHVQKSSNWGTYTVRAYDVKSTYLSLKPSQISPLTLKSLFDCSVSEGNRRGFRDTLCSIVDMWTDSYDFVFEEGRFIVPPREPSLWNSPHHKEMRFYDSHHVEHLGWITTSHYHDKIKKVRRIIKEIGYYPINVSVHKESEKTMVSDIHDFTDMDLHPYHVDKNIFGSISYDLDERHVNEKNSCHILKTTKGKILELGK